MTSHDRRSEPHSMTEEVYRHRITDVIESPLPEDLRDLLAALGCPAPSATGP